MLMVLFYKVK